MLLWIGRDLLHKICFGGCCITFGFGCAVAEHLFVGAGILSVLFFIVFASGNCCIIVGFGGFVSLPLSLEGGGVG